jgi:hypothetical protein
MKKAAIDKEKRANSTELLLGESQSPSLHRWSSFFSNLIAKDKDYECVEAENNHELLNSPSPKRKAQKRTPSAAASPLSSLTSVFEAVLPTTDKPRSIVKRKIDRHPAVTSPIASIQPQLVSQLSTFEHRRIYARRLYNRLLETPSTYLSRLVQHDFYDYINALACNSDLPALPNHTIIKKKTDDIVRLFGNIQAGELLPHMRRSDLPRPRYQNPNTLKDSIHFFAEEIWQLMSIVLPPEFQSKPRRLSERPENITATYFHNFNVLSYSDQVQLSKNPQHLEAVLISAASTSESYQFCLSDAMRDYWDGLTIAIPTEVKVFLMNCYSEATYENINDVHPFEIAFALYDFQHDLSSMYSRLTAALHYQLPDHANLNMPNALIALLDPGLKTRVKQQKVEQSLCYVHRLHDKNDFDMTPEYDFIRPIATNADGIRQKPIGESYLYSIQKKSFSALMRTLYSSYLRLFSTFHQFEEFHLLGCAQQFLAIQLPQHKPVGNAVLSSVYREELEIYNNERQCFNDLFSQFHRLIEEFFTDMHDYSQLSCVSEIGNEFYETMLKFFGRERVINGPGISEKFDEEWFLHALKKLSISETDNTSEAQALRQVSEILMMLHEDMSALWQTCEEFRDRVNQLNAALAQSPLEAGFNGQLLAVSRGLLSKKFDEMNRVIHDQLQAKLYQPHNHSKNKNTIIECLQQAHQHLVEEIEQRCASQQLPSSNY